MKQDELREYFEKIRPDDEQKTRIFEGVMQKKDDTQVYRAPHKGRRVLILAAMFVLIMGCIAYGNTLIKQNDAMRDIGYWCDGKPADSNIYMTKEGYKVIVGDAGSSVSVTRGKFGDKEPFESEVSVTCEQDTGTVPVLILDEKRYIEEKAEIEDEGYNPIMLLIVEGFETKPEDVEALTEEIIDYYEVNGEVDNSFYDSIEEKYQMGEKGPLKDIGCWCDDKPADDNIRITDEGYKVIVGDEGSAISITRGTLKEQKPFTIRFTLTCDKKTGTVPVVILDEKRYADKKEDVKAAGYEPFGQLIVEGFEVAPENVDALVTEAIKYYEANGKIDMKEYIVLKEKYDLQ